MTPYFIVAKDHTIWKVTVARISGLSFYSCYACDLHSCLITIEFTMGPSTFRDRYAQRKRQRKIHTQRHTETGKKKRANVWRLRDELKPYSMSMTTPKMTRPSRGNVLCRSQNGKCYCFQETHDGGKDSLRNQYFSLYSWAKRNSSRWADLAWDRMLFCCAPNDK